MDAELAAALRKLIQNQQHAALASLHAQEPAISMVPYALLPAGQGFIVHVSSLAAHTADMLANPAVALLVMAPPGSAGMPQALSRVSISGRARQLGRDTPDYTQARARYLARFADSEPMFGFADFSLFVIEPRSLRFVGGFARAKTVSAAAYAQLMQGEAVDEQ